MNQIFIFHFKELIDIAKHMESETEVKIHSLVIWRNICIIYCHVYIFDTSNLKMNTSVKFQRKKGVYFFN